MFVELIDHLRCPAAHEESWLVLGADAMEGRHVMRGTLGCPVCLAKYSIEEGVAHFGGNAAPARPPSAVQHDDEWPLRLAAFLGLGEGKGFVALEGDFGRYADPLTDLADVEVLAIDPLEPPVRGISTLVPAARERLPLASGSLRAIAVDAALDPAGMAEAARLLRSGGRLLAPAAAPLPLGIRELARDAAWWVGERDSGVVAGGVVQLQLRRS